MKDTKPKTIARVLFNKGDSFDWKELKSYTKDGHYRQEIDGISFDGHRVLWAFTFVPYTYLKESDLSGDQWRKGGEMIIYRNAVSVFREFCRDTERAFRVMQYKMPLLQEFDHWDDLVVGRKMYNHDVPCILDSVCDDGEIIVRTEDGKPFPWAFKQEEKKEDPKNYEDEWKDKDKVHVLSEHLWWWRK